MKIAFNPSTVAALTTPPNNKDITFDLRGQNIFARGVKFCGTDTNTWRDIKINNVSIGSHTLDLRNGSNTTLTNTNGVVTINSTWRPVVDNLTSDSTTSSLSAKQGKVLKALIDGKSDSEHNHDGRYVRYYTVTTLDCNNLASGLTVARVNATNAASTHHSAYLYISDVGTPFQIQIPDSDTSFIYKRYYSSGKWSGWFKLNAGYADSAGSVAWANVTNKPATATRWPSWAEVTGKPSSFTPADHNHDNKYLRWLGNARQSNMNAIGRISHSSGMTDLSDPGNTIDNPMEGSAKSTSWHLYWQTNYTDTPSGSNAWVAQIVNRAGTDRWWVRSRSGGTITNGTGWTSNWRFLVTAPTSGLGNGNQPIYINSAGEVVAANSYPTSLKSPHSLTLKANGTTLAVYDGSSIKEANFTYANVGAASASHNHDERYVYNYGGIRMDGASVGKNALGMTTNSGVTGDWWHILQAAWNGEYRWNSQIAFPTQNRNGMYYRSGLDDNAKWGSWVKLLDTNNYSGVLDSRYYTESEVNSLLGAKLNRQNLSYGTWNPRGYNLAADYSYNGGDLSISENSGKIYVSIDGQFYQNEGQYRVLDTSDVAGLKGDLTVHQYLSNTSTTWWPLIWGGSSHNNTSNSTGAVYKSYDKLSWQTSSQTLYATNIQTENIKHLSIGGGIYWNSNVESATDSSDAASITLVKSGVAGGTTLVLSQMNDANDTIQFKTNGSARLYHNSYPILTTQNTYVSNNKGYINGTEITQVNNADKVDNRHAISTIPNTGIIYKAAIYTSSSLTSYWVRLASIPSLNQNSEFVATIHVQSGHFNPGRSAILLVYLRGGASSLSKSFKICCNSNYDPNRFRLYYKDSDKTSEIWYQTTGQWDGIITTVISQSSEGSLYEGLTLYSGSITTVQTPSMSTYLSAQVSTITDNISGNASTATKLATPRKIWGQSFDGTADVDNTLRIRKTTGSYCEGIRIQTRDGNWATIILGATADSGTNANAWSIHRKSDNNFAISRNSSDGTNGLVMTSTGMGLGTTTPTQRLDVAGNIRTTGNLYISHATNNNMNHDTSNPRIVFSESGRQAVGLVYTDYDSYRPSKGLKVMDTDNVDTSNVWFEVQGYNYSSGYVKNGSNDNYVLLGGGGHKTLSDFASSSHSHNYAANENYGGFTKSGRLPISGFYQSYASESGGNAPWSSWMHLINCQYSNTNNNYALQIAASFYDNNTFKIRVTANSVNNAWRDIIHSGNIGSQTVANAYHLRINSANTWSTWYWAGQSGQPSWLWGSNDGTNMYVWNPNNFNVNTAQYLRSLGNQNCQTGRTQNYGDVYSYNTYSNNTGSPTPYASVIGFGRGIGGTVEIAGGWCDTNLYWRSLRDCCEDWHSWRTVLDSNNYTDFIGSYYWANVKISTSSSTTTSPTVSNLTATNSIRMSNISLEHTDEINNITNHGGIHLNYRNSGNISLCQGGGNVGIGTMSPSYKLDVKGQVKASGFIHSDHSINDAVLLAGGGYGRIFMLGTTRYYNNTSYELSFHKLSYLCNNLVWVDGCIWNSTSISFQLSSDFYPYPYANSPSMRTIYRMDGNNMITVDGNGIVIISCSSYPRRVGFFYTGRA